MAITGQESINVGVVNEATGADNIFTAFNKTQNNFNRLFQVSSPYLNFEGGPGINTSASGNKVIIENTGVVNVIAGTGITTLKSGSNVTISASGNGLVGVTNVGISSSSLDVYNSPIISSGTIAIELPTIPVDANFTPGTYTAPNIKVDEFGRIVALSNATTFGTVTSVAVAASGSGISVTGSPVTGNGTISIKNTGVTKINAGPGIAVSGSNGDVTISATQTTLGTVTRVAVQSNTLTITNSPITTSGTISVDIPNSLSLSGNLTADNIIGNSGNIAGNLLVGNVSTTSITATANITGGNLVTGGIVNATGNITGSNLIANSLVQSPSIKVQGSKSASAWGTSGTGFVVASATYTDSSSVALASISNAHVHVVSVPTVNASNAGVTINKSATWYISGAPIAGGNVSITNSYALQIANGVVQIDATTTSTSNTTGALRVAGGVGIGGNLNIALDTNIGGNINITGNVSTGNLIETIDLGLSANGTTQTTALLLNKQINVIGTCGTGANGVVLPQGIPGSSIKVVNDTNSSLNVYPAVGCSIDNLTTNLPLVLSANTRAIVTAINPTKWFSF